jgi:hypothetical protein
MFKKMGKGKGEGCIHKKVQELANGTASVRDLNRDLSRFLKCWRSQLPTLESFCVYYPSIFLLTKNCKFLYKAIFSKEYLYEGNSQIRNLIWK